MIKRAAIRDRVYEEQRDQLIPIAESYANQVVKCRAGVGAIEKFREEWTRCFCDQMKKLAVALGIAVDVPLNG